MPKTSQSRSKRISFFDEYLNYPQQSRYDEAAFRRHSREMSIRGMRLLDYFLLFGNLLCWPTDFILFRHQPAGLYAFALWRSALLVCCILGLLMMRSERVKKHVAFLPSIYVLIFLSAVTGGLWMSGLGGLEEPFFYAIYTFAGISAAFFVPLLQRAIITYGLTLCFLLAFFGTHPEHLHHPRLISTLEVMGASDLCYILLGHVIFLLTRKSFFQGLALERKAGELVIANQKSDRLLLNILPAPIAARLKEEQKPIADGFSNVTVLFADIVGFTALSASMPPHEMVQLLNHIFSEFDTVVDKLGLEKIKTIGDAYMVAGGLPLPRADHAVAVANMALTMREIIARYREEHAVELRIRIGIHSGPVVAGVIGSKKFIYDLWGDTVNTASRMESHGLPNEIQISEATQKLLGSEFVCESRGEINVKGIGLMATALLKGRR